MPPRTSMPTLILHLVAGCLLALVPACSTPPAFLADNDVIPAGSRIEFWVDHDERGWVRSNIHIAFLPRPMTGAEARRWAEGTGQRDAGLRWTRYYILVTHPGPDGGQYRSAVFSSRAMPHEITGSPPARRF
jgi:hypothetical protein